MSEKKRKNRLLLWTEYCLVRAFAEGVGLMPEWLAAWTGRTFGTITWALKPRRRRLARENIEKAMPGRFSRREVRRIVRRVFVNVGLTVAELLWARRHLDAKALQERFPVTGLEAALAALAKGRGALVFLAHLGNWELFGASMAGRLPNVHALARPARNPMIDRFLRGAREQRGIRQLNTDEGVRPLARVLREGGTLGVLVDQHVRTACTTATFFGRDAATTTVVASLALRLNVPVFAAYSLRQGLRFRHRAFIDGPIELTRTGDHEADVQANTQLFNDHLETVVREHPEQWLWTYRRWRLADKREREARAGAGHAVAVARGDATC